jgi:hypothetical protein
MRTSSLIAAVLALVLAWSPSARADERHAISPAKLAQAVAEHTASQDADRAAIHEALTRPEVRAVAERTGLDIDRVAASIDTLSPTELASAAASARDVNNALVGGASTITISTTTIIIVLLVVILILVAD